MRFERNESNTFGEEFEDFLQILPFKSLFFVLFLHAESLLEDISGSPFGCVVGGAVKKADLTEREIELQCRSNKGLHQFHREVQSQNGFS